MPDVVIIGGGIVGASIAYHLAEAGCRDVVVVERETQPGTGSTGKSMGGVRVQFAAPLNIRMSRYAVSFFQRFDETMGHPAGYRPRGYLFVATTAAHVEALRANHQSQVAEGLTEVRLLDAGDVARLAPEIRRDDVLGGSFCPIDGVVDPHSVMTGFLLRAMDRGVRFLPGAEVTGISRDGAGVTGVATTRGFLASRTVVNAAGAWAGNVARMAGVDLPVEPLRRMLLPTEPFDGVSPDSPMVIDMASGFHYRPEGRGLLLAWADRGETPGFKLEFDPGFVEKVLARGVERLPCLAAAEVNGRRGWAGLYEMTPDHHPVLGEVKEVPGFYLANGFSGHGVMHSPATGRILADLIMHGKCDLVDTESLNLSRFAAGRLLREATVL